MCIEATGTHEILMVGDSATEVESTIYKLTPEQRADLAALRALMNGDDTGAHRALTDATTEILK